MNWRYGSNHDRLSNRKESGDCQKIKHIAGKGTKSDVNEILGKKKEEQRFGEMKQEESERSYTRHCRENMSTGKNNEDSERIEW